MNSQNHTFLYTCEILSTIYRRHREAIPTPMLKKLWPHGNEFKDGRDLVWVESSYFPYVDNRYRARIYTHYMPIGWAALPALASGLAGMIEENLDIEADSSYVTMTPFCIEWDDWDVDDSLRLLMCDGSKCQDALSMERDSIMRGVLDELTTSDNCTYLYYFGIIENDEIRIVRMPVGNVEAFCGKAKFYIKEGYTPMISQMSRTTDGDIATIMWLYSPQFDPEKCDL